MGAIASSTATHVAVPAEDSQSRRIAVFAKSGVERVTARPVARKCNAMCCPIVVGMVKRQHGVSPLTATLTDFTIGTQRLDSEVKPSGLGRGSRGAFGLRRVVVAENVLLRVALSAANATITAFNARGFAAVSTQPCVASFLTQEADALYRSNVRRVAARCLSLHVRSITQPVCECEQQGSVRANPCERCESWGCGGM